MVSYFKILQSFKVNRFISLDLNTEVSNMKYFFRQESRCLVTLVGQTDQSNHMNLNTIRRTDRMIHM